MKKISTNISDVFILKPDIFEDSRGYFFESFNQKKINELGILHTFVQDNESLSGENVLRGLHFQKPPHEQGKLVRVIKGAVLDVAVDIRKNSPTYGKWVAQELSEFNKLMMWIPPGFAHGFVTLKNETVFFYKCTGFYNHDSEQIIAWNDPSIGINWNTKSPILSDRDKNGTPFNIFNTPFIYK